MKIKLDYDEIKRYIKYESDIVDDVTKDNIKKAIKIVKEYANLKYTYKEYPISIKKDKIKVDKTIIKWESKSLAQHLENCDYVVMIVATLGMELDFEIKKLEITDLSLAYIVNAVAVEYLEKCLDYIQEKKIKTKKNMTSRFSIGYGDLELKNQTDFVKVLDTSKKIGVNVLDTHLMVPSKSVSAIIGLSKKKVTGKLAKCPNCLENGKCSGNCVKGV